VIGMMLKFFTRTSSTAGVMNAGRLAGRLREDGFRGPLILGGCHVTAVPRETLLRFTAFDYGVIGEGEYTLRELLDRLQSGASTDAVAGTARRAGGEVTVNPAREPIEDLDALPFPAWDLLPAFPRGYPHSPLETSRLPATLFKTL
jgi:radical SAM superfamily enzyme YgiQ (UPF0313 family)